MLIFCKREFAYLTTAITARAARHPRAWLCYTAATFATSETSPWIH